MIRRIPVFATLLVLAAVGVMIGLGIWQLGRAQWKHTLIAQYEAALSDDAIIPWPTDPADFEDAYFRRSSVTCASVLGRTAISGRNADDRAGMVQIVDCLTPQGNAASIQLGWSRDPASVDFDGGSATGRITRYGDGLRLIADPPLAGLEPSAKPDPHNLPDNHTAYAFQWFFFAITALVIYALAVRKRLSQKDGEQG